MDGFFDFGRGFKHATKTKQKMQKNQDLSDDALPLAKEREREAPQHAVLTVVSGVAVGVVNAG